jgi:hypothetical protein
MLTPKKWELLYLIKHDAEREINSHLSSLSPLDSPKAAIQNAIVAGIEAAFKTFLDKTYSNEEFESDLGLKDV